MMGLHSNQKELFSYNIDLDARIRSDNPLRNILEQIDFNFVRQEVKELYGYNGNKSVDPSTIMKMMFLLFYDNVPSERELMKIIPERLDYMWFLGYGLNDEIPDHSVLSKARKRWGTDVFETLFTRIVWQCLEHGLIEGKKIFMDASLVDANASNNSVIKGSPELLNQLRELLGNEMTKLDEEDDSKPRKQYQCKNKGLLSQTDPDSAVVRKGTLASKARYKNHRVVDSKHGVITATETTSGDVEENAKLMELVDQHELNTDHKVEIIVADSQYGTADNFRNCVDQDICCHMSDLRSAQLRNQEESKSTFGLEKFIYDSEKDVYICPAGQELAKRRCKKKRQYFEYSCRLKTCRQCLLRPQCTTSTVFARTLKRHFNQEAVDKGRAQSVTPEAKTDRKKRKWLMEGSFADAANNHGFKRSRWRRLWRQKIQDFMIATVQNIRILLKHLSSFGKAAEEEAEKGCCGPFSTTLLTVFSFLGLGELDIETGSCYIEQNLPGPFSFTSV